MKKALLLALSFILVAAISITGTMAYFTDTDSNVNVMTSGNVQIELIEQQRNEDGTALEDFEQGKTMLPIVGSAQGEKDLFGMPTASNYVDKIINIKNTGVNDAWVRVLVAFPTALDADTADAMAMHWNQGNRFSYEGKYLENPVSVSEWTGDQLHSNVEIAGAKYNIYSFTYNTPLAAGEMPSHPAIIGFYLDSRVDYDADKGVYTMNGVEIEGFDGNVFVPVYAQAIQADGFSTSDDAFVNMTTNPWGEDFAVPTLVYTASELQTALDNAVNGDTVILGADIEGDVTVTQKPDVKITLDGNGKTIDGSITVDGQSKRYATAGVTIKNVKFASDNAAPDAYINLGVSGNTDTRYTNNVTVSNCTFDYSGTGDKVAIKSYTGGDYNLTVEGCTANATMHSLVQVANVEKGLTITNCKAYSKNGINLNYTPYLNMSGCEFDTTGYCVRFGVNGSTNSGNFTIADSTLTSANDDGDAVIILRGTMTGATLTLDNVTLTGTPDITGTANIIK